jgi:radical SAM superfamily enzyme YgiQ (UPF0313 family)
MRFTLVGPDLESNLSLGYLASSLRAAGHAARLVSFTTSEDAESVVRSAREADVVGLSLSFQVRAPEFLELASALKRDRPDRPLIAGGHFATCAATELLRDHPAIDLIVQHEAERSIVELAALGPELLARASEIEGVVFRDAGAPRASGLRRANDELDALPTPERAGPSRLIAGVPTAYLMGSRGCIRNCDYCCITTLHRLAPGARFRQRSPENVVAELAELYYRRGVRQFVFHDDNFLVPAPKQNLERIGRYERAMQDAGLRDVGLVLKCGPQDLDRESLTKLKELGLIRLFLGIESGSQCGLDSIGRRQTTEDTERAVSLCEEFDVSSQYTMIIFHPEATIESMLADLDFVDRHPAHPLNYCRAELYAGTPLEQRMVASGRALGTYMARTYRYTDERVARVWHHGKGLFAGRCWGQDEILGQAIRLDHQVTVLKHFYDGAEARALVADFREWQIALNLETAALFRELVVACGSAAADDDPRLLATLEALRIRERATRQSQLEALCVLRARIARIVDPLIEYVTSRAPAPVVPARAPRHMAALLVAASLLGCGSAMHPDDGVAEAAPPPYDLRNDVGVAEAAPPPYDLRHDVGVAEAAPPPYDQRVIDEPFRQDVGVAEAAPPPYDDRVPFQPDAGTPVPIDRFRYDHGVAEAAPPPYRGGRDDEK